MGFDGTFQYPTWDTFQVAHDQFSLNILSHITFLFGLSPELERSTWLPDWSISLEMQFYALFPFIMLAARRFGWLTLAIAISIGCLICDFAFSSFLRQFTLPSIILLKINIFMGGMLIAAASLAQRNRVAYLVAAAALMMLPISGSAGFKLSIDRTLLCVGFGILALSDEIKGRPAILSMVSRTLGTLPFVVMADLSYGAYLIHYPIILLWSRLTTVDAPLSSMNRPFPALIAIPVVTYLLAWTARHLIELPGIELGRQAVNYCRTRLESRA
jgi:peptidoglycan/LPS O-acetylase OafA/YrhL